MRGDGVIIGRDFRRPKRFEDTQRLLRARDNNETEIGDGASFDQTTQKRIALMYRYELKSPGDNFHFQLIRG
jgi:hypothetical protein